MDGGGRFLSSLRSWLVGKGDAAPAATDRPAVSDGIVLPRFLRRPVRLFGRMVSGDVEAPRYAGTVLTLGFLALSSGYGAWLGGEMPLVVQAITSRLGFAIEEVKVSGHHETSEIDILERLGLDGWTSTIGFDAEAARERIAALPWVETVAVRKIYPEALEIRIAERKPFAIWQHGSELSLIERDGRVIAPYSAGHHAALPLIIGQGAPEAAPDFIDRLRGFPELASRAKGYIRVAERRWDVRFENGITVKLPETGEDQALAELASLDRDSGLLSRDILAVDMRFGDRLVVQLTPEAATARDAAVKELLKPRKGKPEKKA
jgi:cell division protein FtsQ